MSNIREKINCQHTRSKIPVRHQIILILRTSVKQSSIFMIATPWVVLKGTQSMSSFTARQTHSWLCSTPCRTLCTNEVHYVYFHVCPGNPAWNVAGCYCISLLQVEWVQAIQLPVCESPPPLFIPLLILHTGRKHGASLRLDNASNPSPVSGWRILVSVASGV